MALEAWRGKTDGSHAFPPSGGRAGGERGREEVRQLACSACACHLPDRDGGSHLLHKTTCTTARALREGGRQAGGLGTGQETWHVRHEHGRHLPCLPPSLPHWTCLCLCWPCGNAHPTFAAAAAASSFDTTFASSASCCLTSKRQESLHSNILST